jgi:hypothetical protein
MASIWVQEDENYRGYQRTKSKFTASVDVSQPVTVQPCLGEGVLACELKKNPITAWLAET